MSLDECKECGALSQASTAEEWTCDYCEHQQLKRDYNKLSIEKQELEETANKWRRIALSYKRDLEESK
jgi:ribosomal protein L37AE/L43A